MRNWLIKYRGELSQEFVANRSGISRGAYSNIEIGKRNPSVVTAKRIAKVLKFDWLLFFNDDCVELKQKETA